MSFDPKLPYKNVDGININLTAQEITQLAADRAQYAAEAAAYVPPQDPVVQLTTLLVNQGIIQATDAITALSGTPISGKFTTSLQATQTATLAKGT